MIPNRQKDSVEIEKDKSNDKSLEALIGQIDLTGPSQNADPDKQINLATSNNILDEILNNLEGLTPEQE